MPGRTDGPGADPDARARPEARGRAPGSQDELRRRLADLPASHPSSLRYRAGQSAGDRHEAAAGDRDGAAAGDRDEPMAEMAGRRRGEGRRPGGRDDARQDGRDDPGQDGRDDPRQDGRAPGPREAAGGAAAVAARLIGGDRPQAPEQDARDRRADDALWARAAALHAAAQARRRGRGMVGPSYPSALSYPPARREPFRPWFTASGEDELWLNAEGTGDPWFADGDGQDKR